MTEIQPSIWPILGVQGIEFLVALLIMAASAIYNWMQKRKQGDADEWKDVEAPRPTQTKPTRPTNSWEEELRKILEGEQPAAPPVIRQERPAPPPSHSKGQATARAHCENCHGLLEFPADMAGRQIHCPHCYLQTHLYPISETPRPTVRTQPAVPAAPTPRPHTKPSTMPVAMSPTPRTYQGQPSRSHEIREVVTLFRNPRTARQAVIASIILNPPKAFEE